jgi:isopentenyldiphosphate isomerase
MLNEVYWVLTFRNAAMGIDPNQELVDVIDADGRVVGTVTRRDMRARRLPHRCVYILVFNRWGELFVHRRTPTKDVYPGHWDVAIGGVLVAGESFDDGARREGFEELGVELSLEPLFPFRHEDAATLVRAMVYRACHDGPFCLQPEEITSGEWLPLHAIPARARQASFCPDGLAVLAQFQARL